MLTKSILRFGAILATAFAMVACGGDDPVTPDKPDTPDIPGGNGGGNPTNPTNTLTPAESKTFLANTARTALDKFNPEDQKEVVQLCSFFEEEFGDLELPSNFDIESFSPGRNAPAELMHSLGKALRGGDPMGAAAAYWTYYYTVDFNNYTGIYVAGYDSWLYSGASDDIVFRFYNKAGASCELRAHPSGADNSGQITIFDRYDNSEITYCIPQNITVTLTAANNVLAKAVIYTKVDLTGHTIAATADITAANLQVKADINGNDSKVTANAQLYVSGEKLLDTQTAIEGYNLCDKNKYTDLTNFDDTFLSLVKGGTATANLMDKVKVVGSVEYNRAVYNALTDYYDCWEYNSRAEAEAAVRRACDTLNSKVKANVYYNNTSDVQCYLKWQYEFDDWYGWNNSYYYEYILDPVMQFPDGTTYSFDDYFSNGFANIETRWNALYRTYRQLWRNGK